MGKLNEQNLLDARIREHYESMPPSEKLLADLLLTFPGHITDYSATELCELADTSRAAASRFFSRLGYKDFNDAKRQAREAKKWGTPLYQSNNSASKKVSSSSQIISDHINREQTNIQRSLEGLEGSTLRALVKAITEQKRIMLVGYRNNHFFAQYFQRQLSLIRDGVTIHPSPYQTIAEELFDISSDDLMIIFGFRRRTRILSEIIELAHERGTPTLLIADPTAAALEKKVKWKIECNVYSTSAFDSYSSVMSLLNLLINQVLSANESTIERLTAIESLHDVLGELSDK